jgi:selenocysteine lyase/cysteine desulfurase
MSFSRQIARLAEDDLVQIERVSAEPFATFGTRFIEAASAKDTDLVFLSQVFFNSGFVVKDLEAIVAAAPPEAMVVIDGYHGFLAVPTSLRSISDRAFFTAGGYKYAQSGEGVCFLAVPREYPRRPLNTGWFAGFGGLEAGDFAKVSFSHDGFRFMGATFDPVGLYRFNAVARLLKTNGLTVARINGHVKTLQRRFLGGLAAGTRALSPGDLIAPSEGIQGLGHFLTFRRVDAAAIEKRLAAKNVIVDHRGDRLRFGFGLYQDGADVDALLSVL